MREYCDYIGEDAEERHPSVFDIPDSELLRRAVKNARSSDFRKGEKHPLWVAVMNVFLLGSNYSIGLCLRFGFNPNEYVKR